MKKTKLISLLAASIILSSCRSEIPTIPSEGEIVDRTPGSSKIIKGLYLLNEGNMGSNKSSIDYFDCTNGYYSRNIFPERNPSIVKELGDVGNDLKIYDNKIFAVINCSNLVEIMDESTAMHIGTVNIPNCRYITFHGDKAYVSTYSGPMEINPEARPGKIIEFDINTLKITREVTVGYQPEKMIIKDGKLYVANSGGYIAPKYDKRVAIVDIEKFELIKFIDVAINLHCMEIDQEGKIYVSSRGDYYGKGSNIFVLDTKTDAITDTLNVAASEMHMHKDKLFIIGSEWNFVSGDKDVTYSIYDTTQKRLLTTDFIKDNTTKEIEQPYGISINPENEEIFICDATDHVTPGYLYCFNPDGTFKWKTRTGDIPAHITFTKKGLKQL